MAEYVTERQEDTQAARAQRKVRLYRIITLGITLIIAGGVIWFYLTASVASQKALREAKNVRMAMKMLAIEQYSTGGTIFDPKQKDGMIPGGAERLRALSEADGKVILTGWDKANSDALSFTYTKDQYVVVFNKYGESSDAKDEGEKETLLGGDEKNEEFAEDGGSWEVYLHIRVTKFGG